MKKQIMMSAAIAGLIGAGALAGGSSAFAKKADIGHCMGANSCKGKSDCATASSSCKGENSCKGKGYLEMTKAKCDKLAAKMKKKDKNSKSKSSVTWEKGEG